jgi:hypothetical protein
MMLMLSMRVTMTKVRTSTLTPILQILNQMTPVALEMMSGNSSAKIFWLEQLTEQVDLQHCRKPKPDIIKLPGII